MQEPGYPPKRLLNLLGWGFATAIFMAAMYAILYQYVLVRFVAPPPVYELITWQLSVMSPWIVIIPLAVWLAEQITPSALVRKSTIAIYLALALLVTLAHMLFYAWATVEIRPYAFMPDLRSAMNHFVRYHLLAGLVIFGAIVTVVGRDARARALAGEELHRRELREAELRAQLADARLRALRLQINPHFLFNTLNTVAMLIHAGKATKAAQMVVLLGTMFRHLMEHDADQMVPLEVELAFLDAYLRLQEFRMEDRLTVNRDIEPDVQAARVPTMILQPLVENAVKHGVARVKGKCGITVAARRRDDMLEFELSNDFDPNTAPDLDGHGIGLANTRARLAEIYGDRATFELVQDTARVTARLRVPFTVTVAL